MESFTNEVNHESVENLVDDVYHVEHPSLSLPGDEYNSKGINLTAQERREALYGRWIKVRYNHYKY